MGDDARADAAEEPKLRTMTLSRRFAHGGGAGGGSIDVSAPKGCRSSPWGWRSRVSRRVERSAAAAVCGVAGRWESVKETPVKGPWSAEEDEHLKRLVDVYGAKKW